MSDTLIVNRSDFSQTELVPHALGALAEGGIRVDIGPFALTANNITYMVTGDMIGYWKFFEPSDYGIGKDGYGRMPVWGYGTVTASNNDAIKTGAKIYGFFPVAKSMDLLPVKLSPLGFQDGTAHRTELHSVYNSYTLVDNDPSFSPGLENLQPILRPLFTTSFLIDDFLADQDFFGAKQVIVLSASSKTALGTAFCLKQRGGVKVTGLTSGGNADFVKGTGFYDQVTAYDDVATLDASVPTALVDMAGNGAVNGALYDHFGDNIVYNCMVGKSHWQGAPPPKAKKGAPPSMFFAPDQAKKRFSDWGQAGFAQKLGARWVPFCQSADTWLDVSVHTGLAPFMATYDDLMAGKSDPAKAGLYSL